jgi:hypothetical protein
MNCETIQNRILALAVATEPTADVREHVAGCPACRAVQSKAVRLDRLLAQLPTPSSELARESFLEQVLAEGPIIRSIPVIPSSVGSGTFRNVGRMFRGVSPKLLSGLAAGVVVMLGGVWFFNRPKPPAIEPELAEKPKHELLARSVKHHVELSQSRTAPERLTIFTKWSVDVTAEAKDVYKAASRDEIFNIAALYEATVAQGIVKQAKQLEDHPMTRPERLDRLQATMTLLNTTAAETTSLAAEAPPDAQAAFKRIATAANNARTVLLTLIEQRGV